MEIQSISIVTWVAVGLFLGFHLNRSSISCMLLSLADGISVFRPMGTYHSDWVCEECNCKALFSLTIVGNLKFIMEASRSPSLHISYVIIYSIKFMFYNTHTCISWTFIYLVTKVHALIMNHIHIYAYYLCIWQ